MGVTSNTDETLKVAQLMGTKTALNEFIAYKKLGQMIANKEISVSFIVKKINVFVSSQKLQ